jgi:(S)-mandelate dehydrogenase
VLLKNGWPRFYNLEQFIPEGQPRDLFAIGAWANANARADLNWDHIARIRKIWPKKLLIKGVQHVEDVRLAVNAGLDGVVLSNHGGRQIDRGVASIQLVRASRDVAGPKFTILADSGFRRGSEIVQALALGADAVLCGRAMLYGLAAGGEAGVTRAIEILRAEIDRTLGLLGVTSIGQLSPDIFLQASVAHRAKGPVA